MRKYMNVRVAILLSLGFLPAVVFAEISAGGVFVEPALTYQLGETSTNYPAPISNSTGTVEGIGIGARLGFHASEVFFLGLDLRYSAPQFRDSSVNYDAKSTSTNWGPVVGIQMPVVGLRVWGSAILGGELNPERSGSTDVNFQNASGYRIGTGLRLSAVSLNLEYQQLKYGQTRLEQLGPFNPGATLGNVNLEDNSLRASLSFPLEL